MACLLVGKGSATRWLNLNHVTGREGRLARKMGQSSETERKHSSRLVPDFVIELRSSSDPLKDSKKKMLEYVDNGVRLGWLIDPLEKKVHVYRANGEIGVLNNPEKVSGEDVLGGFALNVREIW